LNPANDVGTGSFASPEAALRQLSPVWKLASVGLFNRDANNGLNTVTHAPGTSPSRVASMAYQGLKTLPLTRAALDLAPTGQPFGREGIGFGPHKRYGSGQTIVNPDTGQPSTTNPRWRSALVGLPLPTPLDQVQQASNAKALKTSHGVSLRRTTKRPKLRRVKLGG
jgi:hypothetical protein